MVWKILKFKIKNKFSHIFGLLYQKASSNIKLTVLEWSDVFVYLFYFRKKIFWNCCVWVQAQHAWPMKGFSDAIKVPSMPWDFQFYFSFILHGPFFLFVCFLNKLPCVKTWAKCGWVIVFFPLISINCRLLHHAAVRPMIGWLQGMPLAFGSGCHFFVDMPLRPLPIHMALARSRCWLII